MPVLHSHSRYPLPPSQVLLTQGHVLEAKNQPHLGHQLLHGGRRAGDSRRKSQFYKEVFKSTLKDKESFP